MSRVTWDNTGERLYHAGVDRGMLYVSQGVITPWNGLVSVTETPANADPQPWYLDGQKVLNVPGGIDFGATIVTYAMPLEFAPCAGRLQLAGGLFATDQPKMPFSFSYRTLIGNDVQGTSLGYKVHVVFNATAKTADFTHASISNSPTAETYSFDVSTVPIAITGYRPTAHIVVDSRLVTDDILTAFENVLYGSTLNDPRLPTTEDLTPLLTA